MYKVTNVALDPAFSMQRRKAPGMQMEPIINGHRLFLRSTIMLSDADYKRLEKDLARFKEWGVVKVEQVGGKAPAKAAPEPTKATEAKKPEPVAPPVEEKAAEPVVEAAPEEAPAPAEPVVDSTEEVTKPESIPAQAKKKRW